MRTHWYQYGKLRIRYGLRRGNGKQTPLLMFNGVGQSLEVLQPLVDALPGMDVITLDVPGAGLSDVPRRPWRYREHAALAAQLLDRLGCEQVNVFGVSWGGGLAQQFCHQYSQRVQRLVLAAAPLGNIMVPGHPRVYLRMANLRRFLDRSYMQSISGEIYGGDTRSDRAAVEWLLGMIQPPTRKGYIFQTLAMYGWSSLPFLHRLQQPTLILQGHDDPMIPNVNARVMACLIPRARLEFIDCGHLLLLTRLQRITPMIRDFFHPDGATAT